MLLEPGKKEWEIWWKWKWRRFEANWTTLREFTSSRSLSLSFSFNNTRRNGRQRIHISYERAWRGNTFESKMIFFFLGTTTKGGKRGDGRVKKKKFVCELIKSVHVFFFAFPVFPFFFCTQNHFQKHYREYDTTARRVEMKPFCDTNNFIQKMCDSQTEIMSANLYAFFVERAIATERALRVASNAGIFTVSFLHSWINRNYSITSRHEVT